MKTSSEYRAAAKAALRGQWGMAIAVMLVYGILMAAVTATAVGGIILSGALLLGYTYTMMVIFRGEPIKFDNLFFGFRTGSFGSTIGVYLWSLLFTFLWTLLFWFPGIIAFYRYAMAPYILADHPEISGKEAIDASKRLMKGKKWQLFLLDLSFLGWDILSALTFGILALWIIPWQEAAKAAFYDSIKDEVTLA